MSGCGVEGLGLGSRVPGFRALDVWEMKVALSQ